MPRALIRVGFVMTVACPLQLLFLASFTQVYKKLSMLRGRLSI
jgi:hypothetical protein